MVEKIKTATVLTLAEYLEDASCHIRNIIFGLAYPTALDIRFVGKSTRGLQTPFSYFYHDRERLSCSAAGEWVRSLPSAPKLVVLEEVADKDELLAAKYRWVRKLKDMGVPLLNERYGQRVCPR